MSFQAYIDNIKAKTGKTPERGPSRDANLVEQSPTSEQAIKRIEFGKEKEMLLAIGTELLATRAREISAGDFGLGGSLAA